MTVYPIVQQKVHHLKETVDFVSAFRQKAGHIKILV